MKVEQRQWTKISGWVSHKTVEYSDPPELVLAFGGRKVLSDAERFNEIKSFYPSSKVITCSTAGEICNLSVNDDSISLVAIKFEKTKILVKSVGISSSDKSMEAGEELGNSLDREGLKHVMVFSDGTKVNGTSLTEGLIKSLPVDVSVTGGLVGDGADFVETLVGVDDVPASGRAVVVGFYGQSIKIGYGSFGGWDNFGPERLITKSSQNVLYEVDNQPALKLYKEYLGEQAAGLPASGLLFPMSLKLKNSSGGDIEIVRTLLAVNEEDQSMTFAGDMPEGIYARLMKANFDRIIDGAATAANMSVEPLGSLRPELAILISCVGRKLVLKERVEEEIEAVRDALGDQTVIAGFYSYGEICPTAASEKQCQLHNQTMTITGFRED